MGVANLDGFPAGFYERLPSSQLTWGVILDSIKRNALRAIQALFNKNGARVARREWIYALLVAAFFVLPLPSAWRPGVSDRGGGESLQSCARQ